MRFCRLVFDIPPGPDGRNYAGLDVELRQLLDGSWRIYYKDKLIAAAESTEVCEPFKTRKKEGMLERHTPANGSIWPAGNPNRRRQECGAIRASRSGLPVSLK